jgi:hypothetical protein
MRYRLRTLLIVMAVMPPMFAGMWQMYREYCRRQEHEILMLGIPLIIETETEEKLTIEVPEN